MDGSMRPGAPMRPRIAQAALSSEAYRMMWGSAAVVYDLDVHGMIQVVDLEVPQEYPEGTLATRCSGCGQVRFGTPDAPEPVWLAHFADCSPATFGVTKGWQ